MIQGVIDRILHQDKQTLGWFTLYDGIKPIISCSVLELADQQNQRRISRICAGVYTVQKRTSQKFGKHFIFLDVEGRDYILIHRGNTYINTKGCLLFGNDFADFNRDGYLDVTISARTIEKLYNLAPDQFKLTINEI